MGQLFTKYGVWDGVEHVQYYADGRVKQCNLTQANEITTEYGTFIPQYSDDGYRRKRVKPVIFHRNGVIKNLPLQERVLVETQVGRIPAELITWYDNGEIRRVFPLDGNLTGFWTEDDEYELAEAIEIDWPFGKIKQKLSGLQFYPDGQLKDITLWSKDRLQIDTPCGSVEVRVGLSVYPDGTLRAVEPAKPLAVDTPIGTIYAFDPKAMAIHSDSLSLRWTKSGELESLLTSMNRITVLDKRGTEHVFAPQFKPSLFNLEGKELHPLRIQFNGSRVSFNNNPEQEFDLQECMFMVSSLFTQRKEAGTECESCASCASCNL